MPAPNDPAPYGLILSRGLPDAAGVLRLRRDLPESEWRWITRLRRHEDRLRSLVGRALVRRGARLEGGDAVGQAGALGEGRRRRGQRRQGQRDGDPGARHLAL